MMLPCPFCGNQLIPVVDGRGKEVVSWGHPQNKCLLAGWSFGRDRISRWNVRSTGLFMEADEYPIFHDTLQPNSEPVAADMLNRIISWYRKEGSE